jgi:PAS domain S-box-containing protein
VKHPAPEPGLLDAQASRIVDAAHEAIVLVDESQHIVGLNPAATALFGRGADALGQPIDSLIPERFRARHAEHVRAFLASDEVRRAMAQQRRVPALHADGQELDVEVRLSRLDAAGPAGPRTLVAAMLCAHTPPLALQEQSERFQRGLRSVLDLAPVGIWIADGDRVAYANEAATRMFGAGTGEPVVWRSMYEWLLPASHAAVRAGVARLLAGQSKTEHVSAQLATAEGGVRDVEIAIAPLPVHGSGTLQMIVSDVTARRREAQEVERSREALRRLSASVVEAREDERLRIARELHDELGQRLTALKMELASLRGDAAAVPGAGRIEGMTAMLDDTLASLRRIAADLRPLMLDDLGLNAAVDWLARDTGRRIGIDVELSLDESDPTSDPRVSITLYRMVQEALNNVARHAHAKRVRIALRREAAEVVLSVRDDGVGLSERALQREGSFGLLGMHERVQALGGSLRIESPPDGGVRLVARVPLAPRPTSGASR